jgi:DNA gyrase subunit A
MARFGTLWPRTDRSVLAVRRSSKGDGPAASGGGNGPGVVDGDLAAQARRSYLLYAMSVISARALPDVRDGLKPVQRRILFTMFNDLRLTHDARHRKCAKVVGDVIGKYHPHGDTAVYDAMVRLAQDFVMRAPLVDGQGNFGSIDGDGAAAYRYTEARLTKIAAELIEEIKFDTVGFRPTYDGTGVEPEVVPARFPNVLVNGASGIAVGMATSIPPHNLGEVIKACLMLIDDPELSVRKIIRVIKGPDFPTGGRLIAERDGLAKAYETGRGTFKLQGTWKQVPGERGKSSIVITSVPYAVEKSAIVEEIGELIAAKKVPGVVNVQDLSTSDVHVELELSAQANPELAMAYLYKNTKLSVTVKLDLTCLVPGDGPDSPVRPARLDLRSILRHFLDFRLKTVRRRFEFELRKLAERIHILEGFEKIFNDLDRAIKIIRSSDGRDDAATKLMKAFTLDKIQADAILDTRLYRLAKLEIDAIRQELAEKRKRAGEIRTILASETKLWGVIKGEFEALVKEYGTPRKTQIEQSDLTEEFTAESFILEEDAHVLVTRDGWIKRQRALNLETTRMREGDEALAAVAGSTRERMIVFSNKGTAYSLRIHDIAQSSGHGTPIQKLVKFEDGERVIAAVSTDPRVMPEFSGPKPELGEEYEEPYPHMIAITRRGMAMRITLWPFREASTARGRRYGKARDGDEFVDILQVRAEDDICIISRKGRVLRFNVMEINLLAGPGLGMVAIKLDDDDEVVGAWLANTSAEIEKVGGTKATIAAKSIESGSRAGKGVAWIKRGEVKRVIAAPVTVPSLEEDSK